MEKKNIDWSNLGFGYIVTDKRYVSMYKNGAWDDGALITDDKIVMSEDAGVLHYSQSVFEGLKAYTTEDGRIVCFRPDLNAERMVNSALRMEMPPFPQERFIDSVVQTVRANAAWVPPYGTGATLYVRPLMFGISPVIGVKPAEEYMYRVFVTPVGPYFKGGATPIAIKVRNEEMWIDDFCMYDIFRRCVILYNKRRCVIRLVNTYRDNESNAALLVSALSRRNYVLRKKEIDPRSVNGWNRLEKQRGSVRIQAYRFLYFSPLIRWWWGEKNILEYVESFYE